jgi:hypothetical protein
MAERFKLRVYGPSLAEIAGSSLAGAMDVCPLWLLSVVR